MQIIIKLLLLTTILPCLSFGFEELNDQLVALEDFTEEEIESISNALDTLEGITSGEIRITLPGSEAHSTRFGATSCRCSIKARTGTCKMNGCLNQRFVGTGATQKACEQIVRNMCQPTCTYPKGRNPNDPNDSCQCGHITQIPGPNCKG